MACDMEYFNDYFCYLYYLNCISSVFDLNCFNISFIYDLTIFCYLKLTTIKKTNFSDKKKYIMKFKEKFTQMLSSKNVSWNDWIPSYYICRHVQKCRKTVFYVPCAYCPYHRLHYVPETGSELQ